MVATVPMKRRVSTGKAPPMDQASRTDVSTPATVGKPWGTHDPGSAEAVPSKKSAGGSRRRAAHTMGADTMVIAPPTTYAAE
jgi:hypothetical protein